MRYTIKWAKVWFFYGLAGLVYFSVLLCSAKYLYSSMPYSWMDRTVLPVLILGCALFLPMFLFFGLFHALWPAIDVGLLFVLFPFYGVVIGVFFGFLVDAFGEEDESDEKRKDTENDCFTCIKFGINREIQIKEKFLNNCIISGIVLWAVLAGLYVVTIGIGPKI